MVINKVFKFIEFRNKAFLLSSITIIAGMVAVILGFIPGLGVGGFQMGIEFSGGVSAKIRIDTPEKTYIEDSLIRTIIEEYAVEHGFSKGNVVAYRLPGVNTFNIKVKSSSDNVPRKIKSELFQARIIENLSTTADAETKRNLEMIQSAYRKDEMNELYILNDDSSILKLSDAFNAVGFEPNISDFVENEIIFRLNQYFNAEMENSNKIPQQFSNKRKDQILVTLKNRLELAKSTKSPDSGRDPNVALLEKDLTTFSSYYVQDTQDSVKLKGGMNKFQEDELKETLNRARTQIFILERTGFSSTFGASIGWYSTGFILLIIALLLVYITFRFQLKFAVGAIIALVHDSLSVIGIACLMGREITVPLIVTILTLLGYSINDTIVVFDRIRENSRDIKDKDYIYIINKSITQTLSRTIITGTTTLLAAFPLLIAATLLGVDMLFDLAFFLFIGIIIGTYSSIFMASPVLYLWEQWSTKREEQKKQKLAVGRKRAVTAHA